MSEDQKKDALEGSEKIGDTLVPEGSSFTSNTDLPGKDVKTAHGNPSIQAVRAGGHTITSSAYTSAQMFNPEQADLINGYMQSLKQAEKGDVFALAGGTVQPKDAGIATTLNPEVTQSYADFELSERNTQEDRDHDLNIEDAKTTGAMTIELWKVLLMIAGAIALTLLGVKTLG